MDDLVSIIVPVYNVENYIVACVDSIIRQKYFNIEIILVDDGSTDKSGDICEKYKTTDSRIKVIHKKNGGLSDARNKGIEQAIGQYIMFIDSDDVVADSFVEHLYHLIGDTNAEIGICDLVHCYPKKNIEYMQETERYLYFTEEAICQMLYQRSFLVSACGKIFKRKCFDDIQFPLGMLFEDCAIMYQIFDKVNHIAYSNAKLYGYMHRENSITTKKFSKRDCDILTICSQIVEYMGNRSSVLQQAANSYQIVGALRIYLNAPKGTEFDKELRYCKQLIKKNSMGVLLDGKVRNKTKMAVLMFYLSRPIMPYVYKKIDRWK